MRTRPTDQYPGAMPLAVLGCQHVLVMYAGAIAIPLVLGAALGLPKEQIAFLINADLFASGVATIIQSVGFGPFGIRLPVMMGVTFTAMGPMIAIGSDPELGLLGIFGSTIVAGVVGILIAPLVGKLLRFFPPVVTGTEIMAVGLSLISVAAAWSAGGFGSSDFGNPLYLAIAGIVLAAIILLLRFATGFIASIAVLLGLLLGSVLSGSLGLVSLAEVKDAPWFGVVLPFHFGMPKFSFWSVAAMSIVMFVTFIESTGMFLALGEIVGEDVDEKDLVKGFRVDGLGTLFGGIFNTFPHTSYAQNIGLVSVTGIKSRWVCAVAGAILVALALLPKFAVVVASIPPFVLGGAGIVMFGVVTASGIRVLSRVDFRRAGNLYIVAVSLGLGMIPVVSPKFFSRLPHELAPVLESPVLLTAVAAIILNVFFNGVGDPQASAAEIAGATNEAKAF